MLNYLVQEHTMEWKNFWNNYPSKFEETEFLKQVEKTVSGKPISQDQFAALISDIKKALDVKEDDIVLDMCCGNGVITRVIAGVCNSIVGVDYSEPLIKVARKYNNPGNVIYFQKSILDQGLKNLHNRLFTKIYLYEALQHFDENDLPKILDAIREISTSNSVIFIGSIPDIDRLWNFYDTDERQKDYFIRKSKNEEAIGTWWQQNHVVDICSKNGYLCEVLPQNQKLHTAHYRFDVRLIKAG